MNANKPAPSVNRAPAPAVNSQTAPKEAATNRQRIARVSDKADLLVGRDSGEQFLKHWRRGRQHRRPPPIRVNSPLLRGRKGGGEKGTFYFM